MSKVWPYEGTDPLSTMCREANGRLAAGEPRSSSSSAEEGSGAQNP